MLWHAVACGCTCNLVHFIVPMLACVWQVQLLHSNALACCRMRLHMQLGTFHCAQAGMHPTSAAYPQQCHDMLWHAVARIWEAVSRDNGRRRMEDLDLPSLETDIALEAARMSDNEEFID